jgi:hypothetical protein
VAARRIPTAPPAVVDLPTPPDAFPAVIETRRVLDLAEAAHARAVAALGEAEAACQRHHAVAAKQLLDDLAAGRDGEDPAAAAISAQVAAAHEREATTRRAADLARARLADAQAAARREFAELVRPVLMRALIATREALAEAITRNESLRGLAAFVAQHAPSAAAPHELAYPLPSLDRLQLMDEARADLLDPDPEPLVGVVRLRMLEPRTPYLDGELIGLPEHEAQQWVRSGVAELVKPEDAKRLGLDRLAKFDRPVKIRFERDYITGQNNLPQPAPLLW